MSATYVRYVSNGTKTGSSGEDRVFYDSIYVNSKADSLCRSSVSHFTEEATKRYWHGEPVTVRYIFFIKRRNRRGTLWRRIVRHIVDISMQRKDGGVSYTRAHFSLRFCVSDKTPEDRYRIDSVPVEGIMDFVHSNGGQVRSINCSRGFFTSGGVTD